jgi:signal transduction histidine kinase
VARHAGAREVRVTLREIEGAMLLEVRDDGRGIGMGEGILSGTGGLGIVGMRERAIASGGSLSIAGEPGRGTVVSVMIPLRPSAPFVPVSRLTSRAGPASQ